MGKLERIRQLLEKDREVVWEELSIKREHIRYEGKYYWVTGLQVAPNIPIPGSEALQRFSQRIIDILLPLHPTNVSKCYEYAESRRDVIKTAAVYFTEVIEAFDKGQGLERRIAVSIYPCRPMAENLGIRSTIDMGHFECPDPCEKAKRCVFRSTSEGFLYEASRAGRWSDIWPQIRLPGSK